MPWPTEKPKKTRSRKAEVKNNLLQAAHAIVAEQGFRAASIAAVASRADIATGTVYKHFPSKSDLLAEIFRKATQREIDKVAEAIEVSGSVLHKLHNAITSFAKRAIKGRTLAWALIAEPIDPLIDQERLIYRKAYADIFARLLQQGIDNHELPSQDATVSAAAIVGVISEALVGPLSPQTKSELHEEALINNICQFCLRAVSGNNGEC